MERNESLLYEVVTSLDMGTQHRPQHSNNSNNNNGNSKPPKKRTPNSEKPPTKFEKSLKRSAIHHPLQPAMGLKQMCILVKCAPRQSLRSKASKTTLRRAAVERLLFELSRVDQRFSTGAGRTARSSSQQLSV